MKKQAISALLAASVLAGLLAGCGGSNSSSGGSGSQGGGSSDERITVRILKAKAGNEVAVVRTTYTYKPGARLDYAYQVFREGDGTLCAEGSTTQLFIDPESQLMLDAPAYYRAWQARYLRIE